MKIVHVVYSMEMGGAEMLVAQLSRLQRKKGHDVTVWAYSKCGILGDALASEGISVQVMGEAHPVITMLRYLRVFRRTRPDVVHCHNPAPTLHAALAACLASNACVLATRHSLVSPPYDRAAEIKFSLLSRFADWIVGVCDITCENLRGAPLANRSRIVRVYNGAVPLQPVAANLREDGKFTVLFVGRLAAVKDLGTLLRATARARNSVAQLKLWIVGDGATRLELQQLAAQLDLQDTVTFWGEQMQTAPFFSAADAFAMSSTSEGLPMSLLQGMSVGLPAVVTAVGGMKEIVDLSHGGITVPVGDVDSMADALVRLASDDALRAKLGSHAKAAFEQTFSLEDMAANYDRLYRSGRKDLR